MVCESVYFTGQNLNLNGHTLTINGDLYQEAGNIDINSGKLIISGDYRIDKNGSPVNASLRMANALDYIFVGGDFSTNSTVNHRGLLIAGTMEVKGNFLEQSDDKVSGLYNFNARAPHYKPIYIFPK